MIGILLTLSRLVLLPVVIAGVAFDKWYWAAGAAGAAVLTDLADGGLSRMFGQYSKFNKDLDSTVDFVFIHCIFIALFAARHLLAYQFAVIYIAMILTFSLQIFSSAGSGGSSVVATTFGRPTGALEYGYLLVLLAQGVLPGNALLKLIDTILFAALVPIVGIYAVECVIKLRQIKQAAVEREHQNGNRDN